MKGFIIISMLLSVALAKVVLIDKKLHHGGITDDEPHFYSSLNRNEMKTEIMTDLIKDLQADPQGKIDGTGNTFKGRPPFPTGPIIGKGNVFGSPILRDMIKELILRDMEDSYSDRIRGYGYKVTLPSPGRITGLGRITGPGRITALRDMIKELILQDLEDSYADPQITGTGNVFGGSPIPSGPITGTGNNFG